jgi:hypothetical protein
MDHTRIWWHLPHCAHTPLLAPTSLARRPPSSAYSTSSSYRGVRIDQLHILSREVGLSRWGWPRELMKNPRHLWASSLWGVASATAKEGGR